MANITLGGLRPWGTLSGGKGHFGNPMVQELANNYGTQISKYDIIIPVSDGTVAIAAASNDGLLLGVVIGCSYVYQGKRIPSDFVPASTVINPTTVGSAGASYVEYLPLTGDLVLYGQANNGTTATTLAAQIAMIGENVDISVPGSPSTVIGVSTMCLDITTHNTTAANFRVVGIEGYTTEGLKLVGNDPTASRFGFLVVCNEGFLPPYTKTGA
jgi:hypothetical protein